jgi:hydrogenase maturation protease
LEAAYNYLTSSTLVLGIGNPMLRDDGIGPLVVERVRERFDGTDVDFQATSLSGVLLMDLLIGYDFLVVVDAIKLGKRPGKLLWLKLRDFEPGNGDYSVQHRIGIIQALKLGADMGQPMPAEVDILAVEAGDVTTFGEEMTPEVEGAIPLAVDEILHFLENSRTRNQAYRR